MSLSTLVLLMSDEGDPTGHLDREPVPPIVSVEGVDYRVETPERTTRILHGIDLTIRPGEYVAITGPSGSGKSTLLNLIGLLDIPSEGTIRLVGQDTSRHRERERARLRAEDIGFIFQAFHLLPHRTIVENVRLAGTYLGGDSVTEDEAIEALQKVGLGHRLWAKPIVLSGGERQRVAVARAVAGNPRLLLADEPTGNLDSESSTALLELFDQLRQDSDLTIVMITHDAEVAASADRIVRIEDGHVVSDPKPRAAASTQAVTEPSSPRKRDGPRLGLTVLLDEAAAGLAAQPGRTLLTSLGTLLGVATLVATLGLGATAGARIVNRFNELTATEVIVGPGQINPAPLPWDASDRVRTLNGVMAAGTKATAVENAELATTRQLDSRAPDLQGLVIAASPGLFEQARATLRSGRFYEAAHEHTGSRVAVVGSQIADRLSLSQLRTDSTILIDGIPYVIIGVLEDVERSPDLQAALAIPVTTARRDFALDGPGEVRIQTAIGASGQVASEAPVVLRPGAPEELEVQAAAAPVRLRDETGQDINVLLVALGAISLLVGAIGIGNVTLIGVMERRGEIGLRRAHGGQPKHIALQFQTESALGGLAAGLVGGAIGAAIVVITATARGWTPVIEPWVLAASPLIGVLVGLVASAYPAWRAAQTPPADALRSGL